MHHTRLVFQLSYSPFLISLNKATVIVLTWRSLTSTAYELSLVRKKEVGLCCLNSTNCPLPSLIYYSFFIEVMHSQLKNIVNCGMLTLGTSTMAPFKSSLHSKWCMVFLISMSSIPHVSLLLFYSQTTRLISLWCRVFHFLHRLYFYSFP